ncbi:MAG: hypothetical protein A4E28_01792 [Methanocella sp. PtaU1.Bin125]|nr:MAG: hypothetical protein A4E28_01792 [Methanocella sp. PtaU1.Bin125]
MFLYGIAGMAFVALTVAAGYAVVSRLKLGLTTLETMAAAPATGIIGATWIALLAYLITGRLDAGIALSAAVMLAVIIVLQPWKARISIDRSHLPALAIIVAVAFVFMYFCLMSYIDGGYHVAYPLYGDAAFHSAMITSFSQGHNYPVQYPFMAGQPLRYTFLIDFYSAMTDWLGLGLQWSLALPGIVLLSSLLATLYFFGTRFTGRKAGGLICVALIVFSGGLGFVYAFTDWLASNTALTDFLSNHYLNYTTIYEYNLVFSNFIVVILTERTALTGFAAAALIILLFYLTFVRRGEEPHDLRHVMVFAGVLIGLMPMVHTYTYASTMIAAGLFVLMQFGERLAARASLMDSLRVLTDRGWFYFMVPAILLALPQMAWILGQVGESFLRVYVGWMARSLIDIPQFWITNMGLELALLIAGLLIVGREKVRFYLPFAGIFVVANLIIFQPWDYDNHNFFSYWLLPSVPLMAAALLRVYDIRTFGKPLFAILMIFTVLTGVMVAWFMLEESYVEISKDGIYAAEWIAQNTPKDAVFLTGETHNHPVTCVAGRKSFMGFYPWMSTHGIDTNDRVHAVASMFAATSEAELYGMMKEHGIDYVYIGPEEINSGTYRVNRTLFDSMTPVFDRTGSDGYRYRVFQAPA